MSLHSLHPEEDDDLTPWTTVVALDPGGTTGWSVLAVHPESLVDVEIPILANIEHWAQGQSVGHEHKQEAELVELLDAWPDAAVVIERFVLRKMLRGEELLSPVRITAVLEFELSKSGRVAFKQQPSEAKGTATDDRLRAWSLYRREGGEEHARDATRHGITFLRRAKERPKLRHMAWPQRYDEKGELL